MRSAYPKDFSMKNKDNLRYHKKRYANQSAVTLLISLSYLIFQNLLENKRRWRRRDQGKGHDRQCQGRLQQQQLQGRQGRQGDLRSFGRKNNSVNV